MTRTANGLPRHGQTKPLPAKRKVKLKEGAVYRGANGKIAVVGEGVAQQVKHFVIVESPYAGDIARNEQYARAAIRDCILRGEAPFASHLLYTQPGVLRDKITEERELGMGLGWHVMRRADYIVVYADLGFSSGMIRGVLAAKKEGIPARLRSLKGVEWSNSVPADNKVPVEVMQYLRVEE